MNILHYNSDIVFASNPVVLYHDFTDENGDTPDGRGRLSVSVGGSVAFSGCFSNPLRCDISDVLESVCALPPDYDGGSFETWQPASGSYSGNVTAIATIGDQSEQLSFKMVRGGVPLQNLRQLNNVAGSDPMTVRFLNDGANFILTSRTWNWKVAVKETELMPLAFLAKEGDVLNIYEQASGRHLTSTILHKGYAYIDIAAVRKLFFQAYGVISSVFDIQRNDSYSCRVIIQKSRAPYKCPTLKFRNAYGIFERIEIPGEINVGEGPKEIEDSGFMSYDEGALSMIPGKERSAITMSVTTKLPVGRFDDHGFIMSMISSEEVWLEGLFQAPVKVMPSADKSSFPMLYRGPEYINVTLDLVDEMLPGGHFIYDGSEATRPRIHSDEFNEPFN